MTHAKSQTLDMAGDDMLQSTQLIATAATALTFDGITGAPAVLLVENLDAVNYVEIDSANTFDKWPQKLMPGDVVILRSQTGVIYGRANVAAVRIAKVAVEA